jgi:VanZ family protein
MKATICGLRWAIIALAIYWVLLFIGTHIPARHLVQIRANDKFLHAGAFAGLSFLLAWAIPTRKVRSINVLVALVVTIVYAGVDELLQIPVGRTADWLDFFADIAGITMGLSVYVLGREILIASGWRLFETDGPSVPKVIEDID